MIASWIFWRKCAVVYLILLSGLHSAPVRPHYAKIQSSSSGSATNSTVETSPFEGLEEGRDNLNEEETISSLPSESSTVFNAPEQLFNNTQEVRNMLDLEEKGELKDEESFISHNLQPNQETIEIPCENIQAGICGICLMDFEEFDKPPSFSMLYGKGGRCGALHPSHLSCLNEWYKKGERPSCPICLRPALFSEFHKAVKLGDFDSVRQMLDLENFDVNFQDCAGKTGLHYATKLRHADTRDEMARLIKSKGGDPNIADNNEETPISSAKKNGYFCTLAVLRESEDAHNQEDTDNHSSGVAIATNTYELYRTSSKTETACVAVSICFLAAVIIGGFVFYEYLKPDETITPTFQPTHHHVTKMPVAASIPFLPVPTYP